ncbi:phenylalanine--tRNA ligase subunit beta [Actinocrinis puniceicyclus]|uniref:Phenylalanine--tRNA ligase beta subunit n=1 Tax=Actinocrinis puniceicyclus TaxID=977794 RepID=A0A8J7WT91_9ACTN|nr:phenylalanine--tRNA ligase subunit beta [Actinocrinis puniceicyclus]MBS2965597.1 phenylalanine--tRNA ligase subunit beta [Actinocrinis puniceicyclus]
MRVPLSWLREYVELPAEATGRDVAERLLRAGLEVETVHQSGVGLSGPLVVGHVLEIEELTGFKKPIRFCQVQVGQSPQEARGVICGARNFATGDKVVVALPGAVLPGEFKITARSTYGHVSDGMICSARELGLGDDHSGIIVLPDECEVGADAIELLGVRDEVLDIAVTPDRGYCLSMRGIAREAAIAYGSALRDPALLDTPAPTRTGHPVFLLDPAGCDLFVARAVHGIDPLAPSPLWMQRRIQLAGMRPISLIVDITNYVMLEIGQPLHAYAADRLTGPITVRRAQAGELLETLDGQHRRLGPEDLVIADASGPIGLAGVMGGGATEVQPTTTDVLVEGAHFDPVAIARTARRHKLPSEASRRFERGVDPNAAAAAVQRAVDLLVLLGQGEADTAVTVESTRPSVAEPIVIDAALPSRVAGLEYARETVAGRLQEIGCTVEGADTLRVIPPSWRPDLNDPNDLAEEVIRLEGYDRLPSTMPQVPAGRGLTVQQRYRRRVGRELAAAGYVEVLCYPFVGRRDLDQLLLAEDDPRRNTLRLLNPLSDEQPELRTTLLPGLLATLRRNIGRGFNDVALFETGLIFAPKQGATAPPRLSTAQRPSGEQLAALDAALPEQPAHVAVVMAGLREPAGWWGPGRPASSDAGSTLWADAIEAARTVARACGVELEVTQSQYEPWHPGRCARLLLDGRVVGHAGELHPKALTELGLPPRTSAMELDLDALLPARDLPVQGPLVSTFPVATQDVALVVERGVPAKAVETALARGAGVLLESIRLFDVYEGERIGEGRKSLAFSLRFRAADRTLTVEEATAARDAAVSLAAEQTGAVLRGA